MLIRFRSFEMPPFTCLCLNESWMSQVSDALLSFLTPHSQGGQPARKYMTHISMWTVFLNVTLDYVAVVLGFSKATNIDQETFVSILPGKNRLVSDRTSSHVRLSLF